MVKEVQNHYLDSPVSSKSLLQSLKNQKKLQRWNKKENNAHLITNPVGCIKQIDVKNIIELIKQKIKDC